MEKPMRRKDLSVSPEKTVEILQKCEYGTLSTIAADGSVHAVPISFVWHDGAICFHCAREGLKVDNMRANPDVCFSAVSQSEAIYQSNDYVALYQSAVVYGKAAEVTVEAEKIALLRALCERYAPESMAHFESSLGPLRATAVYKIIPERMTGKSNLHKRDE